MAGWFEIIAEQAFGVSNGKKQKNKKHTHKIKHKDKPKKNYNDEFYIYGPKGELVLKIDKNGKYIR